MNVKLDVKELDKACFYWTRFIFLIFLYDIIDVYPINKLSQSLDVAYSSIHILVIVMNILFLTGRIQFSMQSIIMFFFQDVK